MATVDESSDDERLRDLGLLTVRSAKLEAELRDAFCSLIGSKYAVVVAGGQAVSWLIDQCQALVKVNLEMSGDHKAAMKAVLDECRIANEQRNTLIHGVKFGGWPSGRVFTARSRRGTFEATIESWTDETIRAAVSRISAARFALHEAIGDAVSHEARMMVYALHEETLALRQPAEQP